MFISNTSENLLATLIRRVVAPFHSFESLTQMQILDIAPAASVGVSEFVFWPPIKIILPLMSSILVLGS